MIDTSENDSTSVFLRLCTEPNGKVFLLYEPFALRVEVKSNHDELDSKIDKQSLEDAKRDLVRQIRTAQQAKLDQLVGKNEASDTPEQKANRQIEEALKPEARFGSWKQLVRSFEVMRERIFALWLILVVIGFLYKGVQISQERLPEFLHWGVLLAYMLFLTFCIDMMLTDERRRKFKQRIIYWFGPSGMLVLPSLTLTSAAAVFASITFLLHKHNLVSIQPCTGRAVDSGSLMDFYMWHFLKLVPLVKITEILKLNEPLCYTQRRVGLLILLFQALVVLPSVNTVLYYWKNRATLNSPPYDFVFDAGWSPAKSKQG